ncbi:hypothetical protein AAHH86_00110 [Candidatus Hodgkinia cicadicola]
MAASNKSKLVGPMWAALLEEDEFKAEQADARSQQTKLRKTGSAADYGKVVQNNAKQDCAWS